MAAQTKPARDWRALPPIDLLSTGEAEALTLYVAERWRNLDELLRLALFSPY